MWRALVIALLLGAPAAEADNSGLDRLTQRDDTFGWEAVGRVDMAEGFCTGTLIATDLVLTAAHCVFDRARGVPQDVAEMVFRAGLRDGQAVAEMKVAKAVAHPAYDPSAPLSEFSVRHDVALLQLVQPIPAAVAAPFLVQEPGRAREVSVVSYARGREEALSWQRRCGVLGRQDGLLALNCDVDFGSSGAPVFDLSGPRARIVSIISSGNDGKGKDKVAYGMELPGLVAELKMALRTGAGVASAPAAKPVIRRIGVGQGSGDIGARFVKP